MLTSTPKTTAINELERLGLAWHEESQYDLSQLSPDRRIQVRDAEHYAPKVLVDQYAIQMGETQFPPILVTRNGWLVDGNTRVGAKAKRKEKFSPAIVIDVDYVVNGKMAGDLHAIAATLNQQGGNRLTGPEARTAAATLVALGWKIEQIGRATGVKSGVVGEIKRELTAKETFEKVGFSKSKKLAAPALRAFGSDVVTALNNAPYKALAELAVDANLTPPEIRQIAADMKATGTDTGGTKLAQQLRGEMEERIRSHALRGNGRPAVSSQLRRNLGFINGFAETPSALVERSPAAMEEHLRAMRLSVTILSAAISLQERANG